MEVITKSAQETAKLGEKLANNLEEGAVVCLYGELGSGKTVFVQGLAKGLGIKERILSPTFVMIRQYGNFYHIDLYRIENEKDIESLGLEEIWSDPKNIVAIEWAEKIKKILPKKRVDIYFEYVEEDRRKIRIETKNESKINKN
jgi:tRNA threonylcarbamoyladenosine biosynthesis protein TsaE